jgi:CheY-like chemotaxis protein
MASPDRKENTADQINILLIVSPTEVFERHQQTFEGMVNGKITIASGAQEAMELLAKAAEEDCLPDVVVSETGLRDGIDGLALAGEIRSQPDERLKNLPIYLLTAGFPKTTDEVKKAEELRVILDDKYDLRSIASAVRSLHKGK